MSRTPRVAPLDPPYPPAVDGFLTALPLGLFRTLAHNPPLVVAMQGWGGYLFDRDANALPSRVRELVIARVCGLCGCEYEWGVHAQHYGGRVGITDEQLRSTAAGQPTDPCWSETDRALLDAVDELHRTSTLADPTFAALAEHLDEAQIVEVLMLTGWYHAISYAANALHVANENGAPRLPTASTPPSATTPR